MSLVLNNNLPATQRQTHVLVIGVGDYPNLRGGALFATQAARTTFGHEAYRQDQKSAFSRPLGGGTRNGSMGHFGAISGRPLP